MKRDVKGRMVMFKAKPQNDANPPAFKGKLSINCEKDLQGLISNIESSEDIHFSLWKMVSQSGNTYYSGQIYTLEDLEGSGTEDED